MWWPATLPWIEGHHSAGVTATGTMWGIARGEVGGPDAADTYVLVANTSPFAGSIRVRVLAEDDARVERTFAMPANARVNINIREYFPGWLARSSASSWKASARPWRKLLRKRPSI